ncbi:MAG: hypothetical protein AAF514_20895, partial [Verrucomicrobiota bacterium]
AIWAVYSFIAYTGFLSHCCPGGVAGNSEATKGAAATTAAAGVATTETKEIQRYPIDFQWLKAQANTNEGFAAVAMAPTPARAHGTTLPTPKNLL